MARGTSIIVEAGAELIIHNATLTNGCGEMWDGIIVKGNATASQYGSFPNNAQGKVILRNNSRVEYALDAVRVWDPIDGGGISKAGGIVQASRTTFLNNRCDVEFMKYRNEITNPSTFIRCTFEVDDDYRGDDLDSRVTMWAVSGLNFNGCTFKNINQTLQQTYQTAGIYSIDAGYRIQNYCNSTAAYPNGCPSNLTKNTTFDGFYYGVRATKGSGNYTITVDDANFTNNVTGLLSAGLDDVHITRCNFNIGTGIGGTFQHGLVINVGTRYKIQENVFTGVGNPTSNMVGCYIYNKNPDNNDVYKNTFNNLKWGNAASGDNRGIAQNSSTGLVYKCNTHTNNHNDIWVNYGAGIRAIQGSPTLEDGNVFNTTTPVDYNYFNESNNSLKRYWSQNTTNSKAIVFTQNKITQLQNIAYGGTNAEGAVYARNILCFVLKDCPDLLMPLDNTTSGRIMPIDNPLLELTKSNTSIKVYPNPATDYVTFEYKMPQFVETAELLITDLTGKVIRTQKIQQNEGQYLWDTRQVQNGLYLYVLKDGKGSSLASGKISILK